MTLEQAKHYIFMSAKEGYITDDEADNILKKSDKEIIEYAEENGAIGDIQLEEQEALQADMFENSATGN